MLKKLLLLSFLTGGILFFSGCQTHSFPEVTDSEKIYTLPGFSFKAPAGEGWFVGRNDEEKVVFFKKCNQATDSLVAMAVLHYLPDVKPDNEEAFLKMVTNIRNRPGPGYKKVFQTEKISQEKSTITIRFRTIYKDYLHPKRPQGVKYLVTEDSGLLWRHPENKNVGLTVLISKTHLANEDFHDFHSIAKGFIKNVNIEPF